jgi:hypothetical protein
MTTLFELTHDLFGEPVPTSPDHALSRNELAAVMTGNGEVKHQAARDRARKLHRRELLGAPDAAGLRQHAL